MPKNTLFTFTCVPRNTKELREMPECKMKDPFAQAALTVLVLCQWANETDDTIEMLNFLSGPRELSLTEISDMRKKLMGKAYIPFSFFSGAVPENGYEPDLPLTIQVRDTAFSYKKPGHVTLYVQSSGAETPRVIQLRKKESTGEWFLWDHELLDPIAEPQSFDPYN